MTPDDDEPSTERLRVEQVMLERAEREQAQATPDDDPATEQHTRRADKAAYLREKLEERAKSERDADGERG